MPAPRHLPVEGRQPRGGLQQDGAAAQEQALRKRRDPHALRQLQQGRMAQHPIPPGRHAGTGHPGQQHIRRVGHHPLEGDVAEAVEAIGPGHVAKARPLQHVVDQGAGPGDEARVLEHQRPGAACRGRNRPVQGRPDPRHQVPPPRPLADGVGHGLHLGQAILDAELRGHLQQPDPRPPQAVEGRAGRIGADHHQVRTQGQQGLGIVRDGGIGRRGFGHARHLRLMGQTAQTGDLAGVGDAQQDGIDAGKQGRDPHRPGPLRRWGRPRGPGAAEAQGRGTAPGQPPP